MMLLVKHFSWSGRISLFMQFQGLSLVLVAGSRTVLLCLLIAGIMFGIQL